ncbi:MAG: hypothetical protein ACR2ND_00860 [Solirubrobacteraceae bacterium]
MDTTVTLSSADLDRTQRAMIDTVAETMGAAHDQLQRLREQADMSQGVLAVDARATVRVMLEELATLDRIGWPGDGTVSQ